MCIPSSLQNEKGFNFRLKMFHVNTIQCMCFTRSSYLQISYPKIVRYCECFAFGIYCDGCKCADCYNNVENEAARQAAVESILERNPSAFRPKIESSPLRTQDNGVSKWHFLSPETPIACITGLVPFVWPFFFFGAGGWARFRWTNSWHGIWPLVSFSNISKEVYWLQDLGF